MLIFLIINIVISILTAGFGIFFLKVGSMKPNAYILLLFSLFNALSAANIYSHIN